MFFILLYLPVMCLGSSVNIAEVCEMEVFRIQSGDGSCFEFSSNINIQGVNKGQEPPGGTAGAVCSGCVSIACT